MHATACSKQLFQVDICGGRHSRQLTRIRNSVTISRGESRDTHGRPCKRVVRALAIADYGNIEQKYCFVAAHITSKVPAISPRSTGRAARHGYLFDTYMSAVRRYRNAQSSSLSAFGPQASTLRETRPSPLLVDMLAKERVGVAPTGRSTAAAATPGIQEGVGAGVGVGVGAVVGAVT
jgi:hypothetical protein